MGEQVAGLVSLLFAVALMPLVCLPLTASAAQEGARRSHLAGIRTRHTMASDPAWRAGHAAAVPVLRSLVAVAVGAFVLCGLTVLVAGPEVGFVVASVALVVEVGVLLVATRRANEAARTVTEE